jgi:hypothetical protein
LLNVLIKVLHSGTGGVAQVVEQLPSKCEALSSNHRRAEKKNILDRNRINRRYIYIYVKRYIDRCAKISISTYS